MNSQLNPKILLFGTEFNPLPDDRILDFSKLKEPAGHNFKFD